MAKWPLLMLAWQAPWRANQTMTMEKVGTVQLQTQSQATGWTSMLSRCLILSPKECVTRVTSSTCVNWHQFLTTRKHPRSSTIAKFSGPASMPLGIDHLVAPNQGPRDDGPIRVKLNGCIHSTYMYILNIIYIYKYNTYTVYVNTPKSKSSCGKWWEPTTNGWILGYLMFGWTCTPRKKDGSEDYL